MSQITIPYKFTARQYQLEFLTEVEKAFRGMSQKRFFYQIWHRRSGKDKTNMADVAPRRLVQDPCQVKYVYPTSVMGRSNLWEAIDKDGFKFIDHIPKQLRVTDPNDTRMLIKVKTNSETESLFQVVGANHPDSLRGGNPKLFIFSEWAEHDPYSFDVIEPIVRENDGIVIFNTTPKGDNHARALFEFGKNDPRWFVQTLTVDDTGVFSKEQMESIRDEVKRRFEANGRSVEEADAYIQQEYYCSFDTPVLGSYYGAAMQKAENEGRITNVPYDYSLPVHTSWDLGMDDSMTIWFIQLAGNEIRIIDYYENSGEGLQHYATVLQEKKYVYGKHYAPHDIEVRELGTGKSRKMEAQRLGINFTVAPKLSVMDGINAVRSILNRCWFDIRAAHRGIQCLKNYKKDWDEKNMVYRRQPLHNWASHGADGLRTFAVAHRVPVRIATDNFGGVKPLLDGMLA